MYNSHIYIYILILPHFLARETIVPAHREKLRDTKCDMGVSETRSSPPRIFTSPLFFLALPLPWILPVATHLRENRLSRRIFEQNENPMTLPSARTRGISKEQPLRYETKPSARLGLVHTIIAGYYSALAERYIENRMVAPLLLRALAARSES